MQGRVLAVVGNQTVKVVASRLKGGIDLGAAASGLRLGQTGLDLKLLNGIWIREYADFAEDRFVIVNPVESELIVASAQTVGGDCRAARTSKSRCRSIAT